ncbi:MAG: radical SAM protein [Deltaproteobacteria bacterium]|nr:radical SAM protein [Deltaproteobacteria bacterium]
MYPSYIELYENNELSVRLERAFGLLESCRLCPRKCGINRLKNETGICGTGRKAKIASYNSHFGEESPLVGRHGSGTIFFGSCNLLCSFCQNYDISHIDHGIEVDTENLASMMIQLEKRGCHNINFVTPTHVVPQIIGALILAVEHGMRLPLVYNSSGYDSIETLMLLDGIFDIYMPDFKFWNNKWAERYCRAPNYREFAMKAIREMHRQVGDLIIDENGIAVKGLIIRHLVLPNNICGTADVLNFISREISPQTYTNVMDQYRPCGTAGADEFINRRITAQEYKKALNTAKTAGLTRLDAVNTGTG